MKSMLRPRQPPFVFLLSVLLPLSIWLLFLHPHPSSSPIYPSLGLSILAFLGTLYLIPRLAPEFRDRAKLAGKDLLKPSQTELIPESLGLVCAGVYILVLILFIPFAFSDSFNGGAIFPHHQLSVYLSSILSLLIATLLGFLDDVFDIRWRHKLPVPIIASIPLLIVYFSSQGNTNVVVPIPLRPFLGSLIHLGPVYYVYMSLLSTFATNSINILAGINGAEVAQSIVIGASVVVFRVVEGEGEGGFTLYFMIPLVAVSLAFAYHNWYPARVFPGDTLCYLSGMSFAVVGIQGHFSKTLLLFFIPQIFNFIISVPQLFGLVPCPRHRVPVYEPKSEGLVPSWATFPSPPNALTTLILRTFEMAGIAQLSVNSTTGNIEKTTNLTILNVILIYAGGRQSVKNGDSDIKKRKGMGERGLVWSLITIQVLGSIVAFVIRYGIAGLVYDS